MAEDKDWRPASEHSGCLLRLQKLLERAQGFRLLILSHNRPQYRDNLIARLRQAEPDSAVFDLKRLGSLAAFEEELARQRVRQVHLLNLESLRKEQRLEFFKGLNYHREHIARICGGFLLFWMPEHLIARLAVEAADFWAWREQVFDFSLPREPVERVVRSWVETANIDLRGKQERIKEIEVFLSNLFDRPSLIAADLKKELGGLYYIIGKYSEARKMLEMAITEYGELDEADARSFTRFELADLLDIQGKSEQALIILNEQVLPVCKGLKNEKYQAVTMSRIADILLSRGQMDEALKMIEEEILPIFEQLGDLRSKAVTMGKIADILQADGQIDNALKIYEKEELPIYEYLGDVRGRTVTIGKIADIFSLRGEQDKALAIREQEVLPVYERLGDLRGLLISRAKIALLLHKIDAKANKDRIDELLRLALADAKRLKLPREIEWIERIMKKVAA